MAGEPLGPLLNDLVGRCRSELRHLVRSMWDENTNERIRLAKEI